MRRLACRSAVFDAARRGSAGFDGARHASSATEEVGDAVVNASSQTASLPAASQARRRWSLATTGSVPVSELDAIQARYGTSVESREATSRVPPVLKVPQIRGAVSWAASASDLLALEADAETTSATESVSAHVATAPDDVVPHKTLPSIASLRKTKKKKVTAGVKKGNAGHMADISAVASRGAEDVTDELAKLRELVRRAAAVDFTTVDTTTLANAAPDQLDDVRLKHSRDPTRGLRVGPKKPSYTQPDDFLPAASPTVTHAASLLPVVRLTEDELTTIENETMLAEHDEARADALLKESHELAPSEVTSPYTFDSLMRKYALRFYQRYPVGQLVTSPRIIISRVLNKETGTFQDIPEAERQVLTGPEARRLAAEMGLDLVQGFKINGNGSSEPETAVCSLADATSMLMDDLAFYSAMITGPVTTRPVLEVAFTGGITAWSAVVKARFVAEMLYKRYQVRIVLNRFGTAREGFPVFESICGMIAKECARCKALYVCGKLQSSGNNIFCVFQPSTERAPLTASSHPGDADFKKAMDVALYKEQYDREVVLPGEIRKADVKRFNWMRAHGLDWTYRSQGLTLAKQRKFKLFQGTIPKGNKALYEARGDVEFNMAGGSFRKRGYTAQEVGFPRESNLEKAQRGAAVLGTRARMSISEMHDTQETEGHTSTIASYQINMYGDILAMGRFKESLGMKTNRKDRPPGLSKGFATEGVSDDAPAPAPIH